MYLPLIGWFVESDTISWSADQCRFAGILAPFKLDKICNSGFEAVTPVSHTGIENSTVRIRLCETAKPISQIAQILYVLTKLLFTCMEKQIFAILQIFIAHLQT